MGLEDTVENALNEYRAGSSVEIMGDRARVHIFSEEDLPIDNLAKEVGDRTPYWHSSGRSEGGNRYMIRLSERSRL